MRNYQNPNFEIDIDKEGIGIAVEYGDGIGVETVLMRQPYGNSICVSSQAGCNMGCSFCASTLHGMARNLSTGEILTQAMFIQELLNQTGEQINNIVIMGSGEPMLNYDNVLNFIRLVHEPYCLNLGYRKNHNPQCQEGFTIQQTPAVSQIGYRKELQSEC